MDDKQIVIIGGGLASIDVAKACQIDLFRQAIKNKLNKSLDIKWNWVKAHAGNIMNEKVDLLAKKAANLD